MLPPEPNLFFLNANTVLTCVQLLLCRVLWRGRAQVLCSHNSANVCPPTVHSPAPAFLGAVHFLGWHHIS